MLRWGRRKAGWAEATASMQAGGRRDVLPGDDLVQVDLAGNALPREREKRKGEEMQKQTPVQYEV
jgi:hypothetical protein